ncbi:MAG: DUF6311 domain-containing protein [Oscillospiraceae bacterium]|nr:DUF6311 domain-containing protein [Oscillospiraceae bacterium]
MKKGRIDQKTMLALCGALLGVLAFFLIFGARGLDVTDDSWILSGYVDRDIVQHYTGWLFYREAPLSYPLCISGAMNYPYGTSALFTDSIPIACVLFRLIEPLLPETFQYFGLWVLMCFVLQGVFASLTLSMLIDSKIANLLGTLLLVFSPVMIERCYRHTALASQFLILAAFYLYFKNKKKPYRFRVGYLLLSLFAPMIHTYFVPMVCAILFADLVEHAFKKKDFLRSLAFLAANLATVLFSFYSVGFFSQSKSDLHSGYGIFCFNFNSFFNPVSSNDVRWSQILPSWNVVFIYENFVYLGLGMLFACFLIGLYLLLFWKRTRPFDYIKRYPALFGVCVCLTAFAVSNIVTVNERRFLLFDLPESIQRLADMLRSSSRLFWPVYYLIFLFVIVFLARRVRRVRRTNVGAILLAALLCVQLGDMAPTLYEKHVDFDTGSPHHDDPTAAAFFRENGDAFDHIVAIGDQEVIRGMYIDLWAAKNGMTTNDAFFASVDFEQYAVYANEQYEKLLRGELDARTLYVFTSYEQYAAAAEACADSATAAQVSYYFMLIPNSGSLYLPPVCGDPNEPELPERFLPYGSY